MLAIQKMPWENTFSLILVAGFVLVPMFATVLGGFKSLGELRTNPFGLPDVWEFEYYAQVFADGSIWSLMKNSLIIAFFSVLLTLIIGTMTAFTFSHIKFAGYKYIYNYFLIGMMFPAAAAILPLFLKIRDLGLLDSLSGWSFHKWLLVWVLVFCYSEPFLSSYLLNSLTLHVLMAAATSSFTGMSSCRYPPPYSLPSVSLSWSQAGTTTCYHC